MIAASHPFSVTIGEGNAVIWKFNNIMLPDSNINEPLSHGFIRYRVNPLDNLVLGNQVKNKAGIYFDYNKVVQTNQVINTVAATMPVTLSAFALKNNDCKQVEISWTTESEINNEWFIIERNDDGRNWKEVVRIKGAGSSALRRHYHFVDENAIKKVSFYRLKQVNTDGSSSLSFTRSVRCERTSDFVKVYPNPVTKTLFIKTTTAFKCDIYNAQGTLITTVAMAGNSGEVDLGTLPAGLYMVKVTGSDGTSVHRVVKRDH